MTIDELYQISDKFAKVFGRSLWDFLEKWTGFDILSFENYLDQTQGSTYSSEKSLKEIVSEQFGQEGAELVLKCIKLGNFQNICTSIGSKAIPGQRKYLGTTYSKILIPVAVRADKNTKPIQLKEIEGYVLGCLAVNKNGDRWNLQHLPSGLVAGKYSCSAKEAIGKMKLALSFDTIDQVIPNGDCLEKLKELQFSSENL
jgi:hypothetical protein